MLCITNFDDTPGTGVLTGTITPDGVYEYLGYSVDGISAPNLGLGNWPNPTQNWGDAVDTALIESGFYHFKYKSTLDPGDECYGEVTFVLPVSQGSSDVGENVVIDLCSTDPIRNLFADLGAYAEAAVNKAMFVITPPAGIGAAYDSGGAGIADDTYDPSLEPSFPVTRVFTLTVTPSIPAGYSSNGCENCDPKIQTVTYNVKEAFADGTPAMTAVCND